jgi:hypothetical protein
LIEEFVITLDVVLVDVEAGSDSKETLDLVRAVKHACMAPGYEPAGVDLLRGSAFESFL